MGFFKVYKRKKYNEGEEREYAGESSIGAH